MLFEIAAFLITAILAVETPPADREFLAMDDVERHSEARRRMIRMCGPLSVLRVCVLQGRSVDVDATLAKYRCKRGQGVRVHEVVQLSRDLGLAPRAIRVDERSLTKLATPCIMLINDDRHCVVLESVSDRNSIANVWDPADLASKEVDVERLRQHWSGHAIVFDRTFLPALIDAVNAIAFVLMISLFAWSRRSVGNKKTQTP